MTTHERFKRMFEHRDADRVPVIDIPWRSTLSRWESEGMPGGIDWQDYFGVDKLGAVNADYSPRYPEKVLEETGEYTVCTTVWGVTLKRFKTTESTPLFLDFKITDAAVWKEAKERMKADPSRIDWNALKSAYPKWKGEGRWVRANFWFGFDVTHSWMSGTDTILMAMLDEPEWVSDMFNTFLDSNIAHMEMALKAGYAFDEIFWPDDMGYKNTTFFSLEKYRGLLKPVQKRAVEWAHKKGIYTHLHSCGFIEPFIPDLVEIGVDALNPMEVKAGMSPERIKNGFGDKLVLHGGFNAMLWDDKERAIAEIDGLLPVLKENGGYIFSSDHSIPDSVSLENYKAIIGRVKTVGKY